MHRAMAEPTHVACRVSHWIACSIPVCGFAVVELTVQAEFPVRAGGARALAPVQAILLDRTGPNAAWQGGIFSRRLRLHAALGSVDLHDELTLRFPRRDAQIQAVVRRARLGRLRHLRPRWAARERRTLCGR